MLSNSCGTYTELVVLAGRGIDACQASLIGNVRQWQCRLLAVYGAFDKRLGHHGQARRLTERALALLWRETVGGASALGAAVCIGE